MKTLRTRSIAIAVLVGVLALTGAAKVGLAGTGTTSVLTPNIAVLNDQNPLVLGAPTPGGNIGYDISLANPSNNTVNHLTLADTIGKSGTVLFIQETDPSLTCSGVGTDTLSCTRSQFTSGASFDVIVLFKTSSTAQPGSNIVNTFTGTYDPQTPNNTNNRKTDTFAASTTRQYQGLSDGSLAQSLTRQSDKLTAGGPHSSAITLPFGFLNGFNYVGVTLQNKNAAGPAACGTCQPFETDTTIPPASSFGTTGPFFNGTATDGYTWSFTIPVANSFKPTGVYHTDAAGNNGQILPNCAIVSGSPVTPTAAPGICVSSITVNKHPNPNQVTYAGLGIANGHTWGF